MGQGRTLALEDGLSLATLVFRAGRSWFPVKVGQRSILLLSSLNGFHDLSYCFPRPERTVFRLRKWIIHRLVSIVDQLNQEKEEALIDQVARYEMCLLPMGGTAK